MPSTSKTEKLGLNVWTLNDRPHMADFNADNAAVEAAFKAHFEDSTAHLSAAEHENLDNRISFLTYFGTNMPTKEIQLTCTPKFVIVFPTNKAAVIFSPNGRCLFGFASQTHGSGGVSLKDSTLTVSFDELSPNDPATNMSGVTYTVAMFR